MEINDFLNETIIEMMINALISNFKNNKKEFVKSIIKTKEYVFIAPAGHPLMNEKVIKMSLKFSLDKHNILNYLESKGE